MPLKKKPHSQPRQFSRRAFLQSTGLTGSLLILGVGLPRAQTRADSAVLPGVFKPSVFVAFDADGTVRIVVSRSEMGQGVRTALPRIVADELEADLTRVTVVQGVGHIKYGDQNTDGSKSLRLLFTPLREAGATARTMLEQAAANTWNVPLNQVRAENHQVRHLRSQRILDYAELVEKAAGLKLPDQVSLKHPSQFKYIGKAASGQDNVAIVTGEARYGIDVILPGMKYACVARAPVFDARLIDYDPENSLKIDGVSGFYRIPFSPHLREFRPEEGVAVVADNSWNAIRARDALMVNWDLGSNAGYNTSDSRKQLRQSVSQDGVAHLDRGDVDAALDTEGLLIEATYETPLLAHASMEPPVATAWVKENGECEVWAPVQDPQHARSLIAEWLGIDVARVTVNVTLIGGAFGRKSQLDFLLEAVEISRQTGAPIKTIWTREDDIQNDYFHAEAVQAMTARLGPDGVPIAWRMRTAYPSIDWMFEENVVGPMTWETGMGWTNMPFDIANVRIESCAAPISIRIGWLRSVCNVWHAFSINSFVDEMAAVAQQDPVVFRLMLLGYDRTFDAPNEPPPGLDSFNGLTVDTGRYREVLEYVAVKARWGKPLPTGHFRGIAVHNSFYSYAACVVEIERTSDGSFRVVQVDMAVDCGLVVNPEGVTQQIEGATLFGLGMALYGELTAREGRVEQSNFHDYRLMRMTEAPPVIRAHIIKSKAPPTGIGEPPTPVIAPALASALHAASGHRFRRMPFMPQWEKINTSNA